jgi:uncharacterized protein (DUF1778 family)
MTTLTKPATKTKVKEPRTGRMNLRLSTSAKTLLTEAAQLCGLSLSEYVLRHSLEAAHQQLTKARYSPLSEGDTRQLAQRIEEATPPTERLERAAKTYHQRVASVRE